MDPKGCRPTPEEMGVPSRMKQMMEKMCGTGELGPAAMCRGMMSSPGKTAEAAEVAENAVSAAPDFRKPCEQWAGGCCGTGSRPSAPSEPTKG